MLQYGNFVVLTINPLSFQRLLLLLLLLL